MHWIYAYFFPALWLAFVLYWRAVEGNVKATVRLEPMASRVIRTLVLVLGIVLFTVPFPVPALYRQWLPRGNAAFVAGAAIAAAGLLFAVWARRHLGANWSRSVTIKQGHELITGGPYRVVRHPIYTGILAGVVGSAIAMTEVRGLIGVALVTASLWYKLRLEEKWMRMEFGESYEAYARRVSALVPGLL